jgi:hypothetical protein
MDQFPFEYKRQLKEYAECLKSDTLIEHDITKELALKLPN